MALDRDNTLKKAEKLLRQGRLDGAIVEYLKLVEDQPRDWNMANTLGDLYARAGQMDQAVGQYSRIAEHFMREGFYPKAAALYKKILKINKNDEQTQLQLAEISALQGLLADAKAHFGAVAAQRKGRGDRRGEAEIIVRLGDIDPADFDARLTAARTLEEMGEEDQAAEKYKSLHADFVEKDRPAEALDVLRSLVRLRPLDTEARAALARAALDSGDLEGAREFLDRDIAGNDPTLLFALVDLNLRSGDITAAREQMPGLLRADYSVRHRLLEAGLSLADSNQEAAFVCVDAIVEAAVETADYHEAASTLQDFVGRVPGHIAALLKLVEVCVDGGFETSMYEAQVLLTDAYLEAGQAFEARVIAEDLVAREPWEGAHIDRFRRALVMLKVSDPDTEIAERLSGQAPFMATDPFIDLSDLPAETDAAPSGETGEAVPELATATVGADSSFEGGESRMPESKPTAAGADAPYEEIDLTGALTRLDEGSGRVESVSRKNKEAEAAAQSGDGNPDFSAQHMTLARTYLEMGMEDQAEAALRAAAASPRLRFEAGALLGRMLRKRGDTPQALEWLERAAEARPSAEEGRELMYDFGVALDEAGEVARALAVFLELQSEAGDYRDAPERIERLARVQSGG